MKRKTISSKAKLLVISTINFLLKEHFYLEKGQEKFKTINMFSVITELYRQ